MPAVSSLKCAMAHSVPVVKGLSDIVHACVFLLSVSIRRVVAIATLFTVTTNSCDPVCVFAVTCLACGADTQNVETCPVLSLTVPNVSVVYILPISLLTSICTVHVLCTWCTLRTSRLSLCGHSSNNWLQRATCTTVHSTTGLFADMSAVCVCRLVLKCHFSNCWIHKRSTWRKWITLVKICSKTCTW